MTKDIIICSCNSDEHNFIFKYETEDEKWDDVYLSIHLTKNNFWNRLKLGIRYILGRKSRYGEYDEIVINTDDIEKFENVVAYLKKVKIRNEKKMLNVTK